MAKNLEHKNLKQTPGPEGYTIQRAADWAALTDIAKMAQRKLSPDNSEGLWFRGTADSTHQLMPTLMRYTDGLSGDDHDGIEQNLFFEFQAKSPDLRSRNLTDWEYLFYSRHHGLPTRLIDWTDTLGVAVYFALEPLMDAALKGGPVPATEPAIWALNPYSLNEETWDVRDITLPRYLRFRGNDKDYWDFGELLAAEGEWRWDDPVAIYPVQLGDRVRAQRGWFTIHGNSREPLEQQYPQLLWKIILEKKCIEEALLFLEWAGFNKYSIYPDLDNLAIWLRQKNLEFVTTHSAKNASKRTTKGPQKASK
jgi:FRG domain